MDVVELACQLIRCPSVTPDEAGCHAVLGDLLRASGFVVEQFDAQGVSNLWASHGSEPGSTVLLAGHCDVVPSGSLSAWSTNPFEPTVKDGVLYGRGAADMKGSLAAMACAAMEFVCTNPLHPGRVCFLSTSDEEGPAEFGTRYALEQVLGRGESIDYAIVGEPTSSSCFGDFVKVGRRGSLSARVKILGRQGHVAYPDWAENPIHRALPFLTDLRNHDWDTNGPYFQRSSLQIVNIQAGTGALNVIPGELSFDFNLRYKPELSPAVVKQTVEEYAEKWKLTTEIEWIDSANAFHTQNPELLEALSESICAVTGTRPGSSTGGGTSDARFLAAKEIPVCEFGPLNKTIHMANECVNVTELQDSKSVYQHVLNALLS